MFKVRKDVPKGTFYRERMPEEQQDGMFYQREVQGDRRQYQGNYQGERQQQGPYRGGFQRRDRSRDKCFNCGRYGHWTRDCQSRRRQREFFPDRNDRQMNDRRDYNQGRAEQPLRQQEQVQPSAPPMPKNVPYTPYTMNDPFRGGRS